MAGGKLTPRQKMINMMYLVLTALLALNISKDMLKAFAKVNNSLKSNLSNIHDQSDVIYKEFQESAEFSPLKVGPQFEIASLVQKEANDFENYVNELYELLIFQTSAKSLRDVIRRARRYIEHIRELNTSLTRNRSHIIYFRDQRKLFETHKRFKSSRAHHRRTNISLFGCDYHKPTRFF